MKWGRRKQMCIVTLQGDLTEKQFLKIQKAMLKIAERYGLGYGSSDEEGFDLWVWE